MITVFLIRLFTSHIVNDKQVVLHYFGVVSVHFTCQTDGTYFVKIVLQDAGKYLQVNGGFSPAVVAHIEHGEYLKVGY